VIYSYCALDERTRSEIDVQATYAATYARKSAAVFGTAARWPDAWSRRLTVEELAPELAEKVRDHANVKGAARLGCVIAIVDLW
jgi:hypothetical protein